MGTAPHVRCEERIGVVIRSPSSQIQERLPPDDSDLVPLQASVLPRSSTYFLNRVERISDRCPTAVLKVPSPSNLFHRLVELTRSILRLPFILLQIAQRLSPLPLDRFRDLRTSRRDTTLERLRSHIQSISATPSAHKTPQAGTKYSRISEDINRHFIPTLVQSLLNIKAP